MSSLKDKILHKRKKLERTTDNDVVLSIIHDLAKVPMTVDLLQDTGIGKVMRSLSKKEGKIGAKASTLLTTWRSVVVSAQKGEQDSSSKTKKSHHKVEVIQEKHLSHKVKHSQESPSHKVKHEQDSPSHKVKRSQDSPSHKVKHERDSPSQKVKHSLESPSHKVKHNQDSPIQKDIKHRHSSSHKDKSSRHSHSKPVVVKQEISSDDDQVKREQDSPIQKYIKDRHSSSHKEKSSKHSHKTVVVKQEISSDDEDSTSHKNNYIKHLHSKPVAVKQEISSDDVRIKHEKNSTSPKYIKDRHSSSHKDKSSKYSHKPVVVKQEISSDDDSSNDADFNESKSISGESNYSSEEVMSTKHFSHQDEDDQTGDFMSQLSQADNVPVKSRKSLKTKEEKHSTHMTDGDQTDFMFDLSQGDLIKNHKSKSKSAIKTNDLSKKDLKDVTNKSDKHSDSKESKHKSHKSSKHKVKHEQDSPSHKVKQSHDSPSHKVKQSHDLQRHKVKQNQDMPSHKVKHEFNGHSSQDSEDSQSEPKKRKNTEEHRSKKHKSSSKKTEKKRKHLQEEESDLFFPTEGSFEDCLSVNDALPKKKKKVEKKVKDGLFPPPPNEPLQLKLSPKEVYVSDASPFSSLPQPLTNYRPLPHRPFDDWSSPKKSMSNEDAILFTSSKKEKTCVYSGKKNHYYTEVPKLQDACIRVMIEHIDEIGYIGQIPYCLVSPLFEKCTPAQLFNIENYNPDYMDETQGLWEVHCKRDFRREQPLESETWRDLYWRASEEREKKLKSLTASISQKKTTTQNSNRVVKLAYVDSFVKPPRDVLRKQARNGTAGPVNHSAVAAKAPSVAKTKPIIPKPVAEPVFKPQKPKVAPLMAKTLKSMKQCFRR